MVHGTDQPIIVGVVWRGEWQWYVTEKEMWVLDYRKWEQAYEDVGFEHMVPDESVGRFGIAVLNEETAGLFLESIREFRASGSELSLWLEEAAGAGWEDLSKWAPSLLVDFDRQVLVSRHPERHFFERYVPDRWIGEYRDFLREVPWEERYWILEGIDCFRPESPDRKERLRLLKEKNERRLWLRGSPLAGRVTEEAFLSEEETRELLHKVWEKAENGDVSACFLLPRGGCTAWKKLWNLKDRFAPLHEREAVLFTGIGGLRLRLGEVLEHLPALVRMQRRDGIHDLMVAAPGLEFGFYVDRLEQVDELVIWGVEG